MAKADVPLHRVRNNNNGFTLFELIAVLSIIALLGVIAFPFYNGFRGRCAVEAATMETCAMMREGKQHAIDEGKYGIFFDTATGTISLVAKGADDLWNTADDRLVRFFRLSDKGAGLSFGYGSYGPVETSEGHLAVTSDGVSFLNNRMVCNEELTGNAGAVYIRSAYGPAVAITINSSETGYKIYRWNGRWIRH